MATPYDPSTNPYIINPKELPSNQVAAAAVPAKNVGTANQWAQSPYFLPNWSLGGAPATSPVATASVTWPDAQVADRDVAANNALAAEKTRHQASSPSLRTPLSMPSPLPWSSRDPASPEPPQ